MTENNIEFFNVTELEEIKAFSGVILSRLPANLRHKLNPRARFIGRNSTCAEIRFVSDAPYISLRLATTTNEQVPVIPEVKVMRGTFEHSRHQLHLNTVTTIHLTPPDFSHIQPNVLNTRGFSPEVWRIVCSSPSVIFCGLDTFGHAVRPPHKEEVPAFTCLCYGSSITNSNIDGWPMVMGQKLGINVLNLGLAGACHVEPEMAEHIASIQDWNGLLLEMGINILGMNPDEFARRVDYMLKTVTTAHPAKPIAMITIFPSSCRDYFQLKKDGGQEDKKFNEILRATFAEYHAKGANIHLIEGSEIVDDPSCLSTDLLHPRCFGHAVMGLNMAQKLSSIFPLPKH